MNPAQNPEMDNADRMDVFLLYIGRLELSML